MFDLNYQIIKESIIILKQFKKKNSLKKYKVNNSSFYQSPSSNSSF